MKKAFSFLGLALICTALFSTQCFADRDNHGPQMPPSMREEIKRLWSTPTVVVPKSDDDSYELLTLPQAEMEAKLALTDPTKLENEYFRVVEGETEEALSPSDFDGRNVLYHLMEARAYYKRLADKTGISAPGIDHKIVVRVRMEHSPNAAGVGSHFTQIEHENDSGYMPFLGGKEEMWFFVRKRKLRNFDLYNFLTSEALAAVSRAYVNAGLIATSELYRDYDSGIDPAKNPTVIWHEAFHWVGDGPSMIPIYWQGTPPGEDYANYFGSSLYGKPRLADLDGFTGRFYRRDYQKVRPLKDHRASQYNSKSLVPSILWEIRRNLGAEKTDQIVWSSLPHLRASVSEVDLKKALIKAFTDSRLIDIDQKAASLALIEKNERGFAILDHIFGNSPLPEEAAPVKDPAELEDADPTDEEVVAAGLDEIEALHDIPEELKTQGIEMTAAEQAELRRKIDELKVETKKPIFNERVRKILKKVTKPFVRAGEGVGIAAETFQALLASPLVFGTDFFTGLLLGKARITDRKPDIRPSTAENIIGAGGGVLTFYYANQGLNVVGHGFTGVVSQGAMGAVLIDQIVCSRPQAQIILPEDNQNPSELQAYCKRIRTITNKITSTAARAGARAGHALRGDRQREGQRQRRPNPPRP